MSTDNEEKIKKAPPKQEHAQWVCVEKSMLSRVLYSNPVCLLTVCDPSDLSKRNVMTITWLTPINNQGGFICSINCGRFTASFLQTPNAIFVLNVPVRGMEQLVLSIGGCSGASVDKFESIPIQTCVPGGLELPTTTTLPTDQINEDYDHPKAKKKAKLSKKELARLAIAEAAAKGVAIQDCAAHTICRVEQCQIDDGHLILRCTQLAAWCRTEYWDGRNFIPRTKEAAPYLTFLGSQRFGYVVADAERS